MHISLGFQLRLSPSPLRHLCAFRVRCEPSTMCLLPAIKWLSPFTQGQHQGPKIRRPYSHEKYHSLQITRGVTFKVAYFFYTETKTSHSSSRHASCAGHGGGEWGNGSTGAGRRTHCHFQTWPRQRWGLGAGTPLRNL